MYNLAQGAGYEKEATAQRPKVANRKEMYASDDVPILLSHAGHPCNRGKSKNTKEMSALLSYVVRKSGYVGREVWSKGVSEVRKTGRGRSMHRAPLGELSLISDRSRVRSCRTYSARHELARWRSHMRTGACDHR